MKKKFPLKNWFVPVIPTLVFYGIASEDMNAWQTTAAALTLIAPIFAWLGYAYAQWKFNK